MSASAQPSQFLTNLVKLIPVEIIALFAIVKGLIPVTASVISVWVVFGILAVLVPFYAMFAMNVKKWDQVTLMTFAFPIWAVAIGGLPSLGLSVTWLEPWMLSVALALFTLVPPMFYNTRIETPIPEKETEDTGKEIRMSGTSSVKKQKIKSWREI